MADDVNANIRIDLDTSDAVASLRTLQAQISAFNQSVIKSNAAAVAAQKSMLATLTAQIGATQQFTTSMVSVESSVSRLGRAIDKNKLSLGEYFRYGVASSKNFGKIFGREHNAIIELATDRVKRLQTQYIALGEAQNGMTRAMAIRPLSLFNADAAIGIQRQQLFNKLLHDGSTSLINFGKNTQWAGRQLMVGFTVPLTIFGGMAGKVFMDLEREVVKFRRVYGDATTPLEETNGMIMQVQELAKEFTKYGIAVSDTIRLAGDAAAAGAQGEDLIAATAQSTRLSTLGMIDQQQALTATIALQSAFRMNTEELANSINFLNAVENQTVVSLADITEAIPKVAPVIQGLGGDVQDLAVFLAAMREGGVNAAEGANALKSGLASLINPTKNAREQLAKVGIDIDSILSKNKGDIRATVMEFGQALGTLDKFSRQQTLAKVFGKYQFARLGALFENISRQGSQAQRVIDLTAMSVEDLGALAEKELGAIEESVGVKFTAAVEKFRLAIAPIGEVFLKIATPIIDFATKLAEKFNELSPGAKNFVAIMVAGLGVVVPTVIMLIGLFANFAGNIVKGFSLINNLFNRVRSGAGSLEYLSAEQLDAAAAAASLEGQTTSLTGALNVQRSAVNQLAQAYRTYVAAAQATAANLPQGFRRPPRQMATGGMVGGTGNKDSEPALLTPGEFVMNKNATKTFGPILDAMNRGNIAGYADGSRLTQRTHLTGAVSISATEALSERITNSTKQMFTILQKVEQVLGRSVSSIAKVSNLIVEMPSEFNQAMKGGIEQRKFATQFGAAGTEKYKTTAAITKQDFEMLKPHLQILDNEIINVSKDFATVGDENIDQITKKAFSRLPAESRAMLSKIEGLSNQFHNLRVSVQDLSKLTDAEKQRLAAAGITFRAGSDANRQYISAPGLGTASTRTRQETRSAGTTYRRSPLFMSSEIANQSKQLALVASKAAGDTIISEVGKASMKAGQIIAPNIMRGANAASPPPWSVQLGGWIGEGIEQGMTTSLADINARLRQQMMSPQGGFLLPPGPTSPLTPKGMGDNSNKVNQVAASMSKIKAAASKFGSTLMRGSAKMQGAFFALDGLVFGLSMMNNSVGQFAQKVLPAVFAVQGISMMLPLLSNPWTLLVAAVAAVGVGLWYLDSKRKELQENIIKTSIAMSGSSKAFDELSKELGGVKPSERFAALFSGMTKPEEQALTKGQEFLATESGQEMLGRAKLLAGKERKTAIESELLQSLSLQIITPEQALGVARALAVSLKDPMLGSALVSSIYNYMRDNSDSLVKPIESLVASVGDDIDSVLGKYDEFVKKEEELNALRAKSAKAMAGVSLDTGEVYPQLTEAEKQRLQELEDWASRNDSVTLSIGPVIDSSRKLAEAQAYLNIQYREGNIDREKYLGLSNQIQQSQQKLATSLMNMQMSAGDASFSENLKMAALASGMLEEDFSNMETQARSLEKVLTQTFGKDAEWAKEASNTLQFAMVGGALSQAEAGTIPSLMENKQYSAVLNIALEGDDPSLLADTVKMLNQIEVLPEPIKTQILAEWKTQDFSSPAEFNMFAQEMLTLSSYFAANPTLQVEAFVKLKDGEITTATIRNIEDFVQKMQNNPEVSALVDFNVLNLDVLNKANKQWDSLGKKKNISKIFKAEDQFTSVAKQFGATMAELDALPNVFKQAILLQMNVVADIQTKMGSYEATVADPNSSPRAKMAARRAIAGYERMIQAQVSKLKNIFSQGQQTAQKPPIEEPTGGGPDKKESWLESLIKETDATLSLLPKKINEIKKKYPNIPVQLLEAIGAGKEGEERAQEILKASPEKFKAFLKKYQTAMIRESRRVLGIKVTKREDQNVAREALQGKIIGGRKVEKDVLEDILQDEGAIAAILSGNVKLIEQYVNDYRKLQPEQDKVKEAVKQIRNEHDQIIKQLDEQIKKQQDVVQEIQDQIDALEEKNAADQWTIRSKEREKELIDRQIEALERANELDQRRIEALRRQDELRNREADALNHELEQLSLVEDQIRDSYQQRIDALDKVAEINSFIINQQKQQLGLAQSLSEGDIYAATAAAQEMRASQADFAQQQARAGLEQGMENAISGLTTASGLTRDQAEERIRQIKEQSYQTSLLIRDIEDVIYQRNQEMIPLKDQQYQLDLQIRDLSDQIYARETEIYNIRNQQLDPAQKILTGLESEKQKRQEITDEAIRAAEALDDQNLEAKDLVKKVDAIAAAWRKANVQILKANQLAAQATSDLGAAPTPTDFGSLEDYSKAASDYAKKRADIENARLAAIDAATASANNFMATSYTAPGGASYSTAQAYAMGAVGGGGGLRRMAGGLIPYSKGGSVMGRGGMDSVNTRLTPGEFVIRKAMVDKYGIPFLNAINQGAILPPKFNLPKDRVLPPSNKQGQEQQIVAPMYNNYSVNVNVSGTNVSADEIANRTIMKIRQMQDMQIRSGRGY